MDFKEEEECIVCRDDDKLNRKCFICHVCECLVCDFCLDHLESAKCPKCREFRTDSKEMLLNKVMAYSHIASKSKKTNYSKIIYYKLACITRDNCKRNINAYKQFLMFCEKAEAYYFMAEYYLLKNDQRKYIEYLKKSIESEEDIYFADAVIDLGNIYWYRPEKKEALELFLKIDIAIYSSRVSNSILFKLAKTCFQREDYGRAFSIFKELDRITRDGDENSHLIYQYLGHLYNHGLGVYKDMDKAFEYYMKCLGDRKKDKKIKKNIMEMIDGIRKLN